ncbi:DUF4267 domain-containing protein [Sphingomonas faeni]|uniref:DUF4267 domain-containing protein n=1 Tax=Sphingomonas faeni TaxID=185950 RepID=UPI00278860DE|nr:DUF4267 domain-containing protein [Sphingomonas faeni]MDQ0840276.1 hypothetical protein [Sphingomonas faeni]
MNDDKPFPVALATVLLVCAAAFFLLGALFMLAPATGGRVYGFSAETEPALLYVRAIGLRDLALASYIAGLTVGRHRRALAILLTLTTMIPAGDLFLLGTMGSGSAVHYLLHSVSLAGFAGLAWWVRNPTPPS